MVTYWNILPKKNLCYDTALCFCHNQVLELLLLLIRALDNLPPM